MPKVDREQLNGVDQTNDGRGYLNDAGGITRPLYLTVTQTAHGFATGQPVYHSGGSYALAQSDAAATAAEYLVEVIDANTFYLVPMQQDINVGTVASLMETGHPAFTFPADNGTVLFVSETEAGKYTTTAPAIRSYVCTVEDANNVRTLSMAEAILNVPAGGGGGSTTFLALTDTPGSFGTAGQILQVNAGANALEFITNTGIIVDADPATNITGPTEGMVAYDTTDNELQAYDGTSWVTVGSSVSTITQTAHGFEAGSPIYFDGTNYQGALADNSGKGAEFVVKSVIDANTFSILEGGEQLTVDLTSLNETAITLAAGDTLFVSGAEAGKYTNVEPTAESNPVLSAITAGATANVRVPIVYRSSVTAAGGGSSKGMHEVLYEETLDTSVNAAYTVTHNLGIAQADVEDGKYAVQFLCNVSGVGVHIGYMGVGATTAAYGRQNWQATNPIGQRDVSWQANTMIFNSGTNTLNGHAFSPSTIVRIIKISD